MNSIEKILVKNLENNIPLSLSLIGGLDGVKENRNDILYSKFLADIVNLIIDEADLTDLGIINFTTDLISDGLRSNSDEITVKEVVLVLSRNSDKFPGCFNTLIELLQKPSRKSFFKAQYLLAAFQIAIISKVKKHYFLAYLLEEDNFDDHHFFSHYIKILGLSYSYFDDESIFEKLIDLMSNRDNDNGLYEIGMSYLRKGITSMAHNEAYQYFNNAKKYFLKVDHTTQTDAYCYYLILEVLFSYADGTFIIETIRKLLNRMEQAIRLSIGWHNISDAIPWGRARNMEMISWFKLVEILRISMDSLQEVSWFDPKIVIENYLLQLYNANRTLLGRDSGNGVDQLIQPIIQMKFNENETYLYLLDKWISSQAGHELWSDAHQLQEDIKVYSERVYSGNEQGTVEKSALAVPFSKRIPENELSNFDQFKKEYLNSHLNATSLNLIAVFEKVIKNLELIPSFMTSPFNINFRVHVFNTLKFLESRMDETRSNSPAVAYLFKKDQLEDTLQNDYYLYMSALPSDNTVNVEVSDIAGGRADVVFNHLNHKFVFEVKRELTDSSFENIRKQYIGQAAEYQNTGPKLGGLLVLDLTNNGGSIGSIEDNVKVETICSENGLPERAVVVVKIIGNRATPSRIKINE
ncbi:hypothetical protein [Elizabethkingia anophelis]|uniref:Uncharacterized protein n=1 Tax=Elizabethkingia anophelis TaxID=1117645 RepID=A0A494J8R2_9FLAO|nr:hypothetical protein [Elizabethkingia anophelis]AQX51311.1 hypothetical protein AYC66_11760 [Elizabethkingia anophelis]MDV2472703.1 hypothetical protein [Elizabethkingia anophelis]MDV3535849.1 hypothetical protein [Elizabethkingia anophelis]MDV3555595.1 hypothetical protein [Elizabethkingia anophelis]MDV3580511.1 hypothetical protein [Elizabethkingia anophelis]